ncbi:MAG: tetratricopeptide repeat protein [Methanosarcinales archaeon]|nr:tetratricopeptide repeat protein [Methanosarcinales archaeon]
MFTIHRNKLLDRSAPSTDYPDTIATTWEISINEVRKTCQIGVDLLNLCAFLAPDDIYEELIKEGAKYLPNSLASAVINSLIFNDAIKSLRRYSLMEVTAGTMSVHRMVQAVVRDKLTDDDKKKWAEVAVQIVDSAFPDDSDDVVTWTQCSRLLPHALAAAEYSEELDVAANATGRLLNATGLYLQGRAQFIEAKKNYERALEIVEAAYAPNYPDVAAFVNNLGRILHDLGDLQGAKGNIERALEIGEAAYAPNHPKVAICVNNLGRVLHDLGDLEGAKENFERALELNLECYGEKHPNTVLVQTNLNSLYSD